MALARSKKLVLERHVAQLRNCRRCPLIHPPPVSGGAILSKIILVGQAPGVREPVAGKPFAWTAGKTLFRWFEETSGLTEEMVRARIYFAAVCRCFPGKAPGGSDRVPNPQEIENCASWLDREIEILRPRLVIPVGKLAIAQFTPVGKLDTMIGKSFRVRRAGPTVRSHSAATSLRRLALASNSTGSRLAGEGDATNRETSGDGIPRTTDTKVTESKNLLVPLRPLWPLCEMFPCLTQSASPSGEKTCTSARIRSWPRSIQTGCTTASRTVCVKTLPWKFAPPLAGSGTRPNGKAARRNRRAPLVGPCRPRRGE